MSRAPIKLTDDEREAEILKRMQLHNLTREEAEHMVWIIEGNDDVIVVDDDGHEHPDR